MSFPIREVHPRPDFVRADWMELNGCWAFAFDDENVGESQKWYISHTYTQEIQVPFVYQSNASGVADKTYHPVMWYARTFNLTDALKSAGVLLHFGAVDYAAKVWVNGVFAGQHTGGYTPFSLDISALLQPLDNRITVRVEDFNECTQPRGKQYWKEYNEMCWYQPSSGIWQTVWLEKISERYIETVRLTPDIDQRLVKLELTLNQPLAHPLRLQAELLYHDTIVNRMTFDVNRRHCKLAIAFDEPESIKDIHYWYPETPNLYDLRLTLSDGAACLDEVLTYFGMRKIEVCGEEIYLNNQSYYQKLILDQGYWKDTHLTPPDGNALKADIEYAKQLGYNGARKHQKIEDPRYYYWADTLGFLVWGELPSGYQYNADEVENLTRDMLEFIKRDYNHPCIVAWVPLNESWGVRNIYADKMQQDFAAALYYIIKSVDSTRFISNNDGWEMVQQSDIYGIHDYTPYEERLTHHYAQPESVLNKFAQRRLCTAKGHPYQPKPVLITEFGGIALSDDNQKNWGYFGKVNNVEEFLARFENITTAFKKMPYVKGYCYTQLTDVYQETNGLMTIDRKFKVDPERIRAINDKLI